MADVYLARMLGPSGFTKLAVIKRLREEREGDEDQGFRGMFLDEARLAARLNHANIVQTFEVGEDDNGVFLAMEYLEGQPLSFWIKRLRKRQERLPVEVCLYILTSVLEALEYAHALTDYDGSPLGIVHRDVSPQNVFITYQGAVKLVDFGVAKAADASQQTQVGVIKGKIAYMSREQAQGATDLDGRADVFSAAILLWEALTGKRLWTKKGDLDILTHLIQGAQLERPSATTPEVPPELEEVVMKALELSRENRYQSAQAFLEALEGVRNTLGLRTTTREVGLLVAKEFAVEREKVREALLVLGKGGVPSFEANPFAPATGSRDVDSRSGPLSSRRSGPPAPYSDSGTRRTEAKDEGGGAPPPRASNAKWIALGAVAGLGMLGIYASTRTSAPDPGTEPRSHTETPGSLVSTPASIAAPLLSRAESAEALLQVSVTPLSARLYLDDRLLGTNPFEGRLHRDARMHTLRAEAPGYRPREMQIGLDKDRSVEFTLQAAQGTAPWPPPHATTSARATAVPTQQPTAARTFEELTPNQKEERKLQLDTDAFRKK